MSRRENRRNRCGLGALSLLLALAWPAGGVFAQSAPQTSPTPDDLANRPTIILERKTKSGEKREIKIVKTGPDEAGYSAICAPRDDDPEGTPTHVVYNDTSPGGVQVTVDKNVIVGPLAVITQKEAKGNEKGDGRVEMTTGSASELADIPENATDPFVRCGVTLKPAVLPDTVNVTQGKTKLRGSKLVYDDSDGIARIDGPITFNREKLTGKSERIEVNVDEQLTTLVGSVEFRDGNRTSKAGRVDYDDAKNVAVLHGTPEQPAESSTKSDTLKATTIRYNLDTGEVVAAAPNGGIKGTFEDGEPANTTSPNTTQPGTTGTPSDGGDSGGTIAPDPSTQHD